MTEHPMATVVLENHHTGERLALRRAWRGDATWLELKGTLPPHSEGPPLHIHVAEDEEGHVTSGTLTALVGGRRVTVGPGEAVELPRGVAHRWWNEGNQPLTFRGFAGPLVDLDRYLQAAFEVLNAGPAGRPPLFFLAHLALRHRHTQVVLVWPPPLQAVVFRVIVAIGTVLGRYRGTDWPGCPTRCTGVPLAADDHA